MSSNLLSPEAESDLDAIAAYISADNPPAARRLLSSFRATFEVLAATPGVGRGRDDIRPGPRSFPVGEYLVFFRETRGAIELVRVLHGRRDVMRVLAE